jgi:hypothetical protein
MTPQGRNFMKKTALFLISALIAANVSASDNQDTDKMVKALSNIPTAQAVLDKNSFAIVYGGQDISHGKFGTIDSAVLAG